MQTTDPSHQTRHRCNDKTQLALECGEHRRLLYNFGPKSTEYIKEETCNQRSGSPLVYSYRCLGIVQADLKCGLVTTTIAN